MKITIFTPREEFSSKLQEKLSKIGEVNYSKSRQAYSIDELVKLSSDSEMIGADPDNFGGFEKAMPNLTKILETLPNIRGLALSTTSTEWVDLDYCKRHNIIVTNIPHYSTESVAEHTLGLLISLAKNITINDRKFWSERESKYGSAPGFELKGKTLGVVGLGSIGRRVAELGIAIGMHVIAYNRTIRKIKGVNLVSLNELLKNSDAISVHLACTEETFHFIAKKEIQRMKSGVIVVDLIGPVPVRQEVVNKKDMSDALRSGKVAFYAYEAEDLINNPLSKIDNAIGLKGFAWYTKDALEKAKQIWVESILSIVKGKPQNRVA